MPVRPFRRAKSERGPYVRISLREVTFVPLDC